MKYDCDALNRIQDLYDVRDIELTVENDYPIFAESASGRRAMYQSGGDEEVKFRMSGIGFRKMVRDLSGRPPDESSYFRTTFEIDKLDIRDDVPLLAKFDMERQDLSTISVLAEKLISDFPDRKIVFVPKEINIERLQLDGIVALRDHLNEVIESLNYDNIMGF